MDNIIPTNEYTEFEGRRYANPNIAIDETNSFIDRLRSSQALQNQEIARQTQNLGTQVPSSVGGLGANTAGNLSYFTSRYQTPQTNYAVDSLRAAAQASALNQALTNEQNKWKKRYNDAYMAQQLRSYNKITGTNPVTDPVTGSVDYIPNDADKYTTRDRGGTVTGKGLAPGASRITYSMDGYIYTKDTLPDGTSYISNTDDPMYEKRADGHFYKKGSPGSAATSPVPIASHFDALSDPYAPLLNLYTRYQNGEY